jgi:cation transporter-like permease
MMRGHRAIRTASGVLVAGTVAAVVGLCSIGALAGVAEYAQATGHDGEALIVGAGIVAFDLLVAGGLAAAVGRARRPS